MQKRGINLGREGQKKQGFGADKKGHRDLKLWIKLLRVPKICNGNFHFDTTYMRCFHFLSMSEKTLVTEKKIELGLSKNFSV